ncbi:hypothetical protein CFE70_008087 [Pyrenophora teres f. teres 0-1]|uniref:Uncharacterized protein n=1 Tax=Pyrenophora teres f. teres (strain 0-1) TaxID=861557 RepID=E3S4X7_PYRTT|nr:hypothetical protein PTT_17773 [Pyrenophora teres f. teres 0-1]KAE8828805.1 hypothetical protein PTNB85_07993 [Pyrenophora teres f. teres]KAE8829967.1 hypothetical protein HRS9139_06591 [Pyrenophora teres f. teres]KAE8841694.1 hypothetical protein HRS9122_05820 [Pyrenophora teres f. teres]KAE8859797.1 hypothetical protein PTNB29_07028 [Pyrenophora teres f. teres]
MATVTFNKEKMLLGTPPKSEIDDEARESIVAPVSILKASAPEFKQRQSMHPASAIALNHQQYLSKREADYLLCPANVEFQKQQSGYDSVRCYPSTNLCVYPQSYPWGTNAQPGHYHPADNATFTAGYSPLIPLRKALVYADNAHFGHAYTPEPVTPNPPFAYQLDHLNSVQWGVPRYLQDYRYGPGGMNTPPTPPVAPVLGSVTVKKTGKSRRRRRRKGKKNGAQQQQEHGLEEVEMNEQVNEPHEDAEAEHVDVEAEKQHVELKDEDMAVEPFAIEHTD